MLDVPAFHTLRRSTEFYFVRHGESESNREKRIQGHANSSLSDVGHEHARAAGNWFVGKKIDAVLASPLTRAMQTAETIASIASLPAPTSDEDLMELDTGIYSGKRLSELGDHDAELYREFRIHSWEVVPEAERIDSLQARAMRVWEKLLTLAHEGHEKLLCVSHGGMIQWLLKATIGATTQRWMPLFPASNCGIFLFRAESSLPEDRRRDPGPDHVPGTGYYGVWALVNHVPYDRDGPFKTRLEEVR